MHFQKRDKFREARLCIKIFELILKKTKDRFFLPKSTKSIKFKIAKRGNEFLDLDS